MRIQQAYLDFLNLVEKNATNNNLDVDKSRFVDWFNFVSKKYQEKTLDKRNEDAIREMAPLLKYSESLELKEETEKYNIYERPSNFFDLSNVFIKASKGACSAEDFMLDEIKTENLHIRLNDVNTKPSFKARESFYHLLENGVSVYHQGDFEIDDVKLLYYIQMPDVDIEGYIKENGEPSQNINPIVDDKTVNKILQMMAVFYVTSSGDLNSYQAHATNLKI